MSIAGQMTQYAVTWTMSFENDVCFEEFWSKMMENKIDCVTNFSTRESFGDTFYIDVFFKTIKERELAKNLNELVVK